MKTQTIFLTVLFVCCCSLLGSCIRIKRSKSDVLKQVTVTASVANLRTGPGTNYDIASVNADGTGGKWQVSRGTKLDVVAEKNGWYEVRPSGQERTAYIKQTLCANPSASKGKAGNRGGQSANSSVNSSASDANQDASSATSEQADQPASAHTAEEVVEEVKGVQQDDDEVIF